MTSPCTDNKSRQTKRVKNEAVFSCWGPKIQKGTKTLEKLMSFLVVNNNAIGGYCRSLHHALKSFLSGAFLEYRREGRGGRAHSEGGIFRGQRTSVQVSCRGLPKKRVKGGDLIIKERKTQPRGGMQVGGSKSRSRRQRRDPNTIVQPNDASNCSVCAEVFSKIPEPQSFRVFQGMEWAISVSEILKGPYSEEGIKPRKYLRFSTIDGTKRVKYLHGGVVTILTIGGERFLQCSIKEMGRQILKSLRTLTKNSTRRITHVVG